MVGATEKSEASETSEESDDFDASDAFEDSAQKGRQTTRLLAVNTALREQTSYFDLCIAIYEAIDAISTSERCARQWTSIPTFFGDVCSPYSVPVSLGTWRWVHRPRATIVVSQAAAAESNTGHRAVVSGQRADHSTRQP